LYPATSSPESETEKVERRIGISPLSATILAVDNLGFNGVQLKPTLLETLPDDFQKKASLRFTMAMQEPIIGIPAPLNRRIVLL